MTTKSIARAVAVVLFATARAAAEPAAPVPVDAGPVDAAPSELPRPASSNATRGEAMLAYQRALERQKLASAVPFSRQRLVADIARIEEKLFAGRRDEAIGDLVFLVESPRFAPFARSDEGRALVFLLGDALGRAGAYEPSRGYLLGLLDARAVDVWYRRAVDSLVDRALESDAPEVFLRELARVPATAPVEIVSDLEYLRGRVAERRGDPALALAAYARVSERSRFWSQATYLSGLIEVERRNLKRGEELFCRVADPKRTPRTAALFGRGDLFEVRDLARLGLGRVAHEQYRFDDARYYYHLVPNDSERLPEALYETATTRYEAKDYDGARQAIDDLRRLAREHPYQDEVFILDAYVDLAVCRFGAADRKLKEFLARYEPARNAARRLLGDSSAMHRLVDSVRSGSDPALAGLGLESGTARALGALLRVDAGYGRATRRLAELEHQISGLRGAMAELDEAMRSLAASKAPAPERNSLLGGSEAHKLARIESQVAELKRLMRDAEQNGSRRAALEALGRELGALELRASAARVALGPRPTSGVASAADLAGLLAKDRARASELHRDAARLRAEVRAQQLALAREAFVRLDRRLTRLLNRARLGRIETVLGKKRALEIEVEALSQGLLPQSIVDSLAAERYLGDDEEYWPFEGEDWEDEYVGGEGLR